MAPSPRRGEVWWVRLGGLERTVGSEAAKERPALVVSADFVNTSASDVVILIPVTSTLRPVRSHVVIESPEGGLSGSSSIQCEQIRAVSRQRLARPLGTVSDDTMRRVEYALKMLLDLV